MEGFQTITAAVLLVALIVTSQNLLRYLKAQDWNGVLGILLAWAIGLGVAELAAHADVTASMTLIDGAPALGLLDFGSLLLLGLVLGSGGSQLIDWLKARDNTDSAAKPPLVGTNTSDD